MADSLVSHVEQESNRDTGQNSGLTSIQNSPVLSSDHKSSDFIVPHIVKVRKDYTITKLREVWKKEEHQKFLEGVNLYGRVWSSIQAHIGSKTAVQIRSHAQKIFSKVARSGDDGIDSLKPTEIPPPRSKKKCIRPYPRKGNFFSVSGSHVLLSSDLNSSRTTSKQLKLIKNRHASSIASIEEMNIENATSSGQDKSKSFMDLNFAAEENSYSPQGTMKLFGQTILVSNSKTVDLKGRPTAIMDVKETREERSQTGFTSVGCFENVNENCRVVGVQTAQPPENEPGFALLGEIVSRKSRAKCVNMIDNGYLPSLSTIVEVNRFSSPELCVCRKPLQDVNLPLKNSNCSPKGAPVKTLRLFGKTILVTDSQTGVLNGGRSTQVMKTQKEWSRMGSASYMHSINENESHCVGHVQRAQPHENE